MDPGSASSVQENKKLTSHWSLLPGIDARGAISAGIDVRERILFQQLLSDLERRHSESVAQIHLLAQSLQIHFEPSGKGGQPLVAGDISCMVQSPHKVPEDEAAKSGTSVMSPETQTPTQEALQKTPDSPTGHGDDATDAGSNTTPRLAASATGKSNLQSEVDATIKDVGFRRWCRLVSRRIISHSAFDCFLGVTILANAACQGIQSQLEAEGRPSRLLTGSEHFFVALYAVELLLRYMALGQRLLEDNWIRFDILLVALGMLGLWIVDPLLMNQGSDGGRIMSQLLLLRAARLLRLLRALRLLPVFQCTWKLASGLLNSSKTIVSVLVLLCIIVFIFAVLGMDIITQNNALRQDETVVHIVDSKFGSITRTMMTLIQFVFADSIASIFQPLIAARPALIFYFLPLMLIVSISLMNLIVAVIVEEAVDRSSQDRQAKRDGIRNEIRSAEPEIRACFRKIDVDGDGIISAAELRRFCFDDLPQKVVDRMTPESFDVLHAILDVDMSGSVSESEFAHGLVGMVISEATKEELLTLKLVQVIDRNVHENAAVLKRIEQQLDQRS